MKMTKTVRVMRQDGNIHPRRQKKQGRTLCKTLNETESYFDTRKQERKLQALRGLVEPVLPLATTTTSATINGPADIPLPLGALDQSAPKCSIFKLE